MARTAAKPTRRSTAEQIEDARRDQTAFEARKAELARDRQRCLLAGDKDGLDRLRRQAADLQIAEEDNRDLIAALKDRQADERAQAAVKARKDHEDRLLSKQAQHRDCIVNIGRLAGEIGKEFQKAQALGTEVNAGWPWGAHDAPPLLLGSHLQTALGVEFYRTAGQALPGWKCPSITDPRREVIPSLAAKADLAIEYARRRISETPARALVLPTAAAVTQAPSPVPEVEAETVLAPAEQGPTPAPSTVPRGEHAFTVAFAHVDTGEEHVETVVFGKAEFERCSRDALGPIGPAGRAVAIEVAQSRVSENYALKPDGIRFDMQRMLATYED